MVSNSAVWAEVRLPEVSGAPVPRVPFVQVRQPIGRHETATFRLHNLDVARRVRRDTPVEIRWGRGRTASSFVGYVNRVQSKTVQGQVDVTVLCVGASSSFSSSRNRGWSGGLVGLVSEVARLNRFHALVEPSEVALQVNQAGRSDWELLVSLAERTGRVLYARGMLLVLVTRDYWMTSRASAPRLTVRTFNPESTLSDPRTPSTATVQGMDEDGNIQYSVTVGTSSVVRTLTDRVTRSAVEITEAAAANLERARYSIRATALAAGDARVSQGKPVYVSNVLARYSGYWLTDEVVHTIAQDDYTMTLQLVTDALAAEEDGPVTPTDIPMGTVDLSAERPPSARLSTVNVLDAEDSRPSDLDAFTTAMASTRERFVPLPTVGPLKWGASR